MKFRNIQYCLEGDGGFAKSGKGIKEALKKHLIKGAQAYFSTSTKHDDYWMTYGAKADKVYRYPFSSIRESDICSEFIDNDKKQIIRNELGITAENVVLSIGRFIPSKGYDVLLRACKYINNAEIYIIGGSPTSEYLEIIEDFNLSNIHFIEFKLKEELKKYFILSDLFVLPTRGDSWGLVINEAMAYGLPVITTEKCIAGLELIKNYENGFVIPEDEEKKLAEKINLLIVDQELRVRMGNNNILKISEYTIEAMARRHMEVFNRTNILFIGYAISKVEASNLYGASIAGNKMQINVLKSLSNYNDLNIKCLTIYPTAAYPKGKLFVKKSLICLFGQFNSLKINFINIPIIKQLFETLGTYKQAKKIVKKEKIETIFTFNMFPQIGLPARWLKNKYGCKIVSLLADLPIDEISNRKGILLIFRKIFDVLTKKLILCCDKIIALNKNAVDLYAPGVQYIVVEGGIALEDINEVTVKTYLRKNIVYSGALVEYSGIINLIEAMKYVCDNEVTLEIYGDGEMKEYIIQYIDNIPNIKYQGSVDNITMLKIQAKAYLLINPRPIENPISKVTFPSKIFEYMISGTPVLTTKLNGLTDDYLDNMFIVDNNEPLLLADKINEIMSLPFDLLSEKAVRARAFVIENKTWEQQCKKIYGFIKNSELKEYINKESYE